MNKKLLFIAILIIIIGGGFTQVFLLKDKTNNVVGEFTLSDYQYFLDNYPSDKSVKEIDNADEAKIQAEKLWIEIFEKKEIKWEKPYNVSYDPSNKVWLVYGSLPKNYLGGVAYILIQQNGKVLAIWHEK
ncbi:MAG: NTF2 fold immunity protein [Eubacteriaceae bacterium]